MARLGEVAIAAAILGAGLAVGGSSYPSRRRLIEDAWTLDEVEEMWVHRQMTALRQRQRKAAKAIGEFAKAFGPYAHRYGYGPHPESRAVARRLRQQARKQAKEAR